MIFLIRTLPLVPLAILVIAASACSDNEAPPAEDHTPVRYSVLVDDVPVTPPYTLTAGETVRVRLKFFNAAEEDLDAVESSHFGGLIFNPASLATAVRVAGHNYQFDVTGGTAGTGTVEVGYGHNEQADEHSFDPEALAVTGP